MHLYILIACSQAVLEVSKYRVQLDKLKKEQRLSELEFEKDQLEFNDVRSQLEKTVSLSNNLII